MTYRGHIEGGKVILDDPAGLPDGTEVDVQPTRARRKQGGRRRARAAKPAKKPLTISKRLLRYAGCLTDLPPDASRNLDHYLYGHPKR